jgi:hypothetical protein
MSFIGLNIKFEKKTLTSNYIYDKNFSKKFYNSEKERMKKIFKTELNLQNFKEINEKFVFKYHTILV